MGKAVPKSIKMRAEEFLKRFPEKFGDNFEKNKEAINQFGLAFSKFDRNKIAGFITRKTNEKMEAVVQQAARAEEKADKEEKAEAEEKAQETAAAKAAE